MENSAYKKILELHHKEPFHNGYVLVESVPFSINHKIGVSQEGFPLFFVKCTSDLASIDINLELISVLFSQECSIRENKKDSKEIFTIVLLKTLNRDLQQYFTDVFSIILQQLPTIPSEKELYKEIKKVIDLFSSINKAPIKSIQGLWSELLIINSSKNPGYFISAWHVSPTDKYDFNDGKDKLEVKSTSKLDRIHRFSIQQLQSNIGSNLVIASLNVIETGVGKSVLNLRDSIVSKIKSIPLHLKLNEVIYKSIGSEFEKLGDVFFDYQFAIDSLFYYNSNDIPKILQNNIPVEISNVTFDCDLSNVPYITHEDTLLMDSELFQKLKI